GDLREDIHSRLKVRFRLPFFVDALITCANPDDAVIFVVKHLRGGELGKNVNSRFFAFFTQPLAHLAERKTIFAFVLERRRYDRCVDHLALGQVPRRILSHHRVHWAPLLEKIWHQLTDRDRVHDRTRQNVRPDKCTFFDDGDLDLADLFAVLDAHVDKL